MYELIKILNHLQATLIYACFWNVTVFLTFISLKNNFFFLALASLVALNMALARVFKAQHSHFTL